MARDLDTPVDRPDIQYQAIDGIRFEIPHRLDGTNGIVLHKTSIRVGISVTNYDVEGQVVDRQTYYLNFSQWPAAFVTEANSLYSMIETWAEGQGIIYGSGTTETI